MHGTRYDRISGRLARVTDRTGARHARLTWSDAADRLVRLEVDGAVVDGVIRHHPMLGDAQSVGDTAMTALDWARPAEIPAIAAPGRLPLGAGAAILNTIALLARDAGVAALRYAGPYPTAALWRSLARSFRCNADEAAFTAGALDRAVRVARDPIPIDFIPAPHERIAIPGGFVELRDRLERAVIDGVGYEPGGSPARLVDSTEGAAPRPAGQAVGVPTPRLAALVDLTGDSVPRPAGQAVGVPTLRLAALVDPTAGSAAHLAAPDVGPADGPAGGHHAEVWFGDACYARVATLAADGSLVAGPHPIPACTSPVIGQLFPAPLRDVLAELIADAVPAPLADDARALCATTGIAWADLGARAAAEHLGGFAVHAALWDRIAPLGLARLALALAEALAPVVAAAIVRRASPLAPHR